MAPASSLLPLVLLPLVPLVLLTEAFLCLRRLALTPPQVWNRSRSVRPVSWPKAWRCWVSGSC